MLSKRRPRLPDSKSYLFTHNLYACTLLDTTPLSVQFICQQASCKYAPILKTLALGSTGNLIKHYKHSHTEIALNSQQNRQKSYISSDSSSAFFAPHSQKPSIGVDNTRYQELVLDLIVANNLAFRLIDSPEFHALIEFLNP